MSLRCAVLGYVPPSHVGAAQAFMDNIRAFKTHFPLILYSDAPWPDTTRILGTPEIMKGARYSNGETNTWSVANMAFLTGIRIARDLGLDYFICIEADCRVNCDGWDKIIWDEFSRKAFSEAEPKLLGGSIVVYNPCNQHITFSRAWHKFLSDNAGSQFPIPAYGGKGSAQKDEPAVFPNGALGVYDRKFLESIMDISNCAKTAGEITAWDYHIGRELVRKYGTGAFDKVVHLDSVYSGYGDVTMTEAERIACLTRGDVVAVHQVKSAWTTKGELPIAYTPPIRRKYAPMAALEWPEERKSSLPIAEVESSPPTGKHTIFICTYHKDFPYLVHCLRSIERFARRHFNVVLVVPTRDLTAASEVLFGIISRKFLTLTQCDGGEEWEGKGFLWHAWQIMKADQWCPTADYIYHLDPDCIFTAPVTPDTFLRDGMPILRYEAFETIGKRHPGILRWKEAVEACLPDPVLNEYMRGHPEVYHRGLYARARQLIEFKTGKDTAAYIRSCKNEFPQTFAEFPTLGAVAHKDFTHLYFPHDCGAQENPDLCPYPLIQFWSHGKIDEPQTIWINGKTESVIPIHLINKILQ